VDVMHEGGHSGAASGIVPSSFRIMRTLLDRIEDQKNGQMLLPELFADIPDKEVQYARDLSKVLGKSLYQDWPLIEGMKPVSEDLPTLLINRTWQPTLCITGVDGIPQLANAGNVLRPQTTLTLSIRLPPPVNPDAAEVALRRIVTQNVPYNARATLAMGKCSQGWQMPPMDRWLEEALHTASNTLYKKPCLFWGEGGSIPFMGMLGRRYPQTQFVILGVLGPGSNAHGSNEFLHLQMGTKVTSSVAYLLHQHYVQRSNNKKRKVS